MSYDPKVACRPTQDNDPLLNDHEQLVAELCSRLLIDNMLHEIDENLITMAVDVAQAICTEIRWRRP